MTEAYYAFLGICVLIALSDWRAGILACVLVDVIRDPVRKLDPGHPVFITVAGALVWAAVFVSMYQRHHKDLRAMLARYPAVRRSFLLFVAAILPGAAMSCLLYPSGWKLAAIGGVSYLVSFLGLAIGAAFPSSERTVYRFTAFYVVVNSVALIGTLAEYADVASEVLGGINMTWLRHHGGYTVELISGIYRSPDIMGLHAAHVVVLSFILAMRRRNQLRAVWIGLACWGGVSLLLCGRRKMIAIPLAFLACYLLVGVLRGVRTSSIYKQLGFLVCLSAAGLLLATRERQVSSEYLDYAATLMTRGASRSNELVVGSVLTTVQQTGLLGAGLGSATQGSYYVGANIRGSWQEDGASRLFREFGVPGALLIAVAIVYFGKAIWLAIRSVPANHPAQELQIALLSVGVANGLSFIASHQQYSGDPVNMIFAAIYVGAVFGIPWMLHRPGSPLLPHPGR